jgi:hypothetical protein
VLSPCDQFALKRDALVDRGGQRAVSSSAKSSSAKDVLSAGCCGGADEDDEAPPCAQPLPFDKIAIIGAGVMSNVIVCEYSVGLVAHCFSVRAVILWLHFDGG